MSSVPQPRFAYADYLAFEAASELRHEFLDGAVVAMSGGTPAHSALAASVIVELGVALRGGPCRVYTSDLRVLIAETGLATYPDVSVVCGEVRTDPRDPHAATNPIALVEVLSPTTEAHDRGQKAEHYRQLASLREYVLVSQDRRRVEVQRRNASGAFEIHVFGPGQRVELASLGIGFDVDALYGGERSS